MLHNYNKENINPKYIKKLEEVCYIEKDYNKEKAFGASKACGPLFLWTQAMYDYYTVYT